jgi:hypothetical protein
MGLVAGRVAHDFNNVLTLIIGYAEVLERTPDEDAQRMAVRNINRAARRAASLTQQLLGLAARRPDVATAVDLAAELRGMGGVLEHLGGDNVTVKISAPDEPVVVALSPSGAEQVVLNLAINACQSMPGAGALAVRLTALTTGDASDRWRPAPRPDVPDGAGSGWAVLTVADNGTGMSEEVRAHCMEPFFTTKTRGQGTGLGLPTVLALVSAGGGQVDIDSALGEGTTVTVWLPLSGEVPLTGEEGTVGAWSAGNAVTGRALLVEDDDELRELGARVLGEAGLRVATAGSAEEGARVFKEDGPFDVLVSDVSCPAGPASTWSTTSTSASLGAPSCW